MNFDKAFDRLVGHEGGFTNDSRDAGNWTGGKVGVGKLVGTKFGLSAATYPTLDIKNITIVEAKEIYKRDWWDKLGAEKLDSAIVFQLWDFAVNSGIVRAIKGLQSAVGATPDGVLGARTIAATNAMELNDVLLCLIAERLKYLTSLSTFSTYGKGWVNRCADNLKYAAQDN